MKTIPKIGELVRFHFSAMTLDEAKTYGVNLNKFSHIGRVVEVYGRDSRFVKVQCKALGDKIICLDSEALVASMEKKEVKDTGNSVESLASKFNNGRNK